MWRPLDISMYDTDWPVMNGRVTGLHDARVIVNDVPAGFGIPGEVVITSVSSGSITFALADRENLSPVASTEVEVVTSGDTGGVTRVSGDYMTVDVVSDGREFLCLDTLPVILMPCCVIWTKPAVDVFDGSILPYPRYGWKRTFDFGRRRLVYTANEPVGGGSPTPNRLRLVNGVSPVSLVIDADGGGVVATDSSTSTITITPMYKEPGDRS